MREGLWQGVRGSAVEGRVGVVGHPSSAVRCPVGSGASVNEQSCFVLGDVLIVTLGCCWHLAGRGLGCSPASPTLPQPPSRTAFTRRGRRGPLAPSPSLSKSGLWARFPRGACRTPSQSSEPPSAALAAEVKGRRRGLAGCAPRSRLWFSRAREQGRRSGRCAVRACARGEGAGAHLTRLCSPFSLP